MRITKQLLIETIDTLNTIHGLPVGRSFKHDNFFLAGAYDGWKLSLRKNHGHHCITGYLSSKELYHFYRA